jgi:SAM-dependent methyltransferase
MLTFAEQTNRNAYAKPAVVKTYAKRVKPGLTSPETFCFDLIPPELHGSVLDIGIGAGRTTNALAGLFHEYVGVDLSAELIAAAKNLWPGRDLRVMDARDLEFGPVFDCAFFSFNGIDSVDFATRAEIVAEMYRVVKPGGYLLYSTHNIKFRRVQSWMTSFWSSDLYAPARRLRFVGNRMRNFSKQRYDEANAIAYVNDPGVGFRLLNAYLDINRELDRLRALGLSIEAVIGNTKVVPEYDDDDCWVHILARKPSEAAQVVWNPLVHATAGAVSEQVS